MFFVLSKTVDALLSPLSWAMLLLLAGMMGHRGARPIWAPLGALLILAFFSVEPVANALVRRLETSIEPTDRPAVTYDAVVLLGGMVEDKAMRAFGKPSYNDHIERLLTTYEVLRSGHAKQAILSGGAFESDDPIVEAHVLSSQLQKWGIDRAQLLVEDHSRNTRENAEFSKRIIDAHHFKRLLLVTSAEHMARALDCFHKVGLDPDALPVDYRSYDPAQSRGSFIPRASALADSSSALRELLGRWVYRLVGYG